MRIEEEIRIILDKYLDDDFSSWVCGDHRPSEDEIFTFEGEYGLKLPDDFRELCLSYYGAFYIEVKEEVWPRAEEYSIGPHWTFLYGFYVYGFGEEVSEFQDIQVQTKVFRAESGQNLLPILKVICEPNIYCMDVNGDIFQWDSVTGELEPVDMSFLELFECEMQELKERKEEKKR